MKRALTEMNGVMLSSRPMRISAATPKKTRSVLPYIAITVWSAVYIRYLRKLTGRGD